MTKYLAAALCILTFACGPIDSWNPPKVGYVDTTTGCAKYLHNARGPDAYDIAHGRPYHCEAQGLDLDYVDIDQVDQ